MNVGLWHYLLVQSDPGLCHEALTALHRHIFHFRSMELFCDCLKRADPLATAHNKAPPHIFNLSKPQQVDSSVT